MKVVLFCGGLGMRLREYSEAIPKPMVPLGYRPILWHVMKYYAHFGHTDFILCLGYKGDVIKRYFLEYDECVSNDFVLSGGGSQIALFQKDIADWTITFADTGMSSNIGQRLLAVRRYLQGEATFLANYADGLTDLHLPQLIDLFRERDATGAMLCVRPRQTMHTVMVGADGRVQNIAPLVAGESWINGGYFVFRQDIFDYLREGEELVDEPFHRLVKLRRLVALRYPGFWSCMDTYKEKQALDEMCLRGETPWEIWKTQRGPQENRPVDDSSVGTSPEVRHA